MKATQLFIGGLFSLVFILSGCGSDSSDDAVPYNPNALLSGDYTIYQIGENINGVHTLEVDVNSDGNGNGTFSIVAHSQGGSLPTPPAPFTYSVASDRTFSATPTTPGTNTDYGMLSVGGGLFVIVDANTPVDTDNEKMMAVGLSTDCNATPTLTQFRLGLMGVDDPAGTAVNYTALVDLDFTSLQYTVVYHSIVGSGAGDDIIYSPSPNNDCTFTFELPGILGQGSGFVSPDGRTLALADTDVADQDIYVAFGLQKSSGLSNSDLSGDYWLGQMGEMPDPLSLGRIPYTSQVDATSQGNGSANAT